MSVVLSSIDRDCFTCYLSYGFSDGHFCSMILLDSVV